MSEETRKAVNDTLEEREGIYGDFTSHAAITQTLKSVMQTSSGWGRLSADKRQSLEVISDKIGRILNGDPEYRDNWHDIAGYAILAEERCRCKQTAELPL